MRVKESGGVVNGSEKRLVPPLGHVSTALKFTISVTNAEADSTEHI